MDEDREFQLVQSALADRYVLEGVLGRGGMAVVYRARDIKHDRTVAVKVLNPEFGVTLGVERFLREINIESRLQHPNILAVFDSGQAREFLHFVLPFAEEGSLRDRLERESPLPVEDALRITKEVGAALTYAHGKGIVHRDVKPANVLFFGGHAVLADFGIAQAISDVDEERLTRSGVSIGTPAYMSPEQAAGSAHMDQRSDLYSLACVLFEMLAGEPPFTGPNARVVLARQASERPPSVELARPAAAGSVASALRKALAKVPADRHPTVAGFVAALEAEPTAESHRSRRVLVRTWRSAAVAAMAALGLVGGWWFTRPEEPSLSPEKIAVFPFASRGFEASDPVDGAGVAYLVGAALEHADPLRFIDVTDRLDRSQLDDPERIPAPSARRIALELGAGFYLRGVVQRHLDSATVILRAYDVPGDSLLGQRSATGDAASVPIHHLGIDAIQALLPALIDPTTQVDLTPLRDRELSAVALWWQGEKRYRDSNFGAALELYERALAEDSALAIAAIKGAQAAGWIHESDRARTLVDLASLRRSLLPDRYVVLAEGLKAYYGDDADSAAEILERAVVAYPDWWEAWAALGEVYYHLLPAVEAPLDSLSRAAFERSLELESAGPQLFHLTEMSIRDGESTKADPLFDLFRRAGPDQALYWQLFLMKECVSEPGSMDWRGHAREMPTEVLLAGKSLSAGGLQPDCAEGALRAVLDSPSSDRSHRWGAFVGLQNLLVAMGRDREAELLIDSVAVNTGLARSLYVLGTLAGAKMDASAAELESYARERFGSDYSGVVNSESLWVLSQWLRHTRDYDQLKVLQRTMSLRGHADSASPRDRLFADAVAALGGLGTDSPGTIARLEEVLSRNQGSLAWGFGDGLAPERILLSQLLLDAGRYREAWVTASALDHPGPMTFLSFVPTSLLIRSSAARALGNEPASRAFRARLEVLGRTDLVSVSH
jgi:serine/threonine protein kinase